MKLWIYIITNTITNVPFGDAKLRYIIWIWKELELEAGFKDLQKEAKEAGFWKIESEEEEDRFRVGIRDCVIAQSTGDANWLALSIIASLIFECNHTRTDYEMKGFESNMLRTRCAKKVGPACQGKAHSGPAKP